MNNNADFVAILIVAAGMFFVGAVVGSSGTETKFTKALCNNDPIELECKVTKKVSP